MASDEDRKDDPESVLEKVDGLFAVPNGAEEKSLLPHLSYLYEHTERLNASVEALERSRRRDSYLHTRAIIAELEEVAEVARAAESELSRQIAEDGRVSVAAAKLLQERLKVALESLTVALD